MADEEGSKKIPYEQFKRIFKEHRLKFLDNEIDQLFKWFDKTQSKIVNYDEIFKTVVVKKA